MNPSAAASPGETHLAALQRYYRFHARIYDLSRWSFLKGRKDLMVQVAAALQPRRILEVGCGTGANLLRLARSFPRAELCGLDLSGDMLAVAGGKLKAYAPRLTLVQAAYDRPLAPEENSLEVLEAVEEGHKAIKQIF